MSFVKNSRGQATVEYILVFAILFLTSIQVVRAITGVMETTSEQIASVLSHQASSGYCNVGCMAEGYDNSILTP